MMKTVIFLIAALICLPPVSNAQTKFRVMSYNVENLFDTIDDPGLNDGEFLPTGSKKWTQQRYLKKLRQVAEVISAGNGHEPAALTGLCEVENDTVMVNLLNQYSLRKYNLGYCLSGKSDRRGIRVALVYRNDKFRYISHKSVRVKLLPRQQPTRDILHVWGTLSNGDTLDIAVCHFPSKSGGEEQSKPKRLAAAETLDSLCDSLSMCRKAPLIIVMGDFNDTPDSDCMKRVAGRNLNNMFGKSSFGSYKYRGKWEQIDHILAHKRMSKPGAGMSAVAAQSLMPDFIMKYGKNGKNPRPLRTYQGNKYEGGVSDHLPVVADFVINSH